MPDSEALPRPPELRELRDDGAISVFLDFDGTLVELAATPDGIAVPAGLSERLHDLSALLDGRLALISGRAIIDIERHLGQLAIARAGSHGADCQDALGGPLGSAPEGMETVARTEIADFAEKSGMALEDKPHGAALHYRHDPSLEGEGLDFAEAFAGRHDLAVKRGKFVIEMVAPGADKGSAVRAFMAESPFEGSLPIFIGDDVTDEDGFAAAARLGGFGILVGDRPGSMARYRLTNPASVYQWLGL